MKAGWVNDLPLVEWCLQSSLATIETRVDEILLISRLFDGVAAALVRSAVRPAPSRPVRPRHRHLRRPHHHAICDTRSSPPSISSIRPKANATMAWRCLSARSPRRLRCSRSATACMRRGCAISTGRSCRVYNYGRRGRTAQSHGGSRRRSHRSRRFRSGRTHRTGRQQGRRVITTDLATGTAAASASGRVERPCLYR